MFFTIADLVQRAGVSSRTIRDYISIGYLEPPTGRGPGATYTEEQLLQATCVARMRRKRIDWDTIREQVCGSSLEQLRAYVEQTEKAPEAAPEPTVPPAPPPSPEDPPELEGEPASPRRRLPHAGREDRGAMAGRRDAELPEGPRWVLVSLLPGMALMVRDDAAPFVRRAAAEIIEQYGAGG